MDPTTPQPTQDPAQDPQPSPASCDCADTPQSPIPDPQSSIPQSDIPPTDNPQSAIRNPQSSIPHSRLRAFFCFLLRARAWWILPLLLLGLLARWPGMQRSVVEDEVSSFSECRVGFGYSEADLEHLVVFAAPTSFWTSHQLFKLCDELVAFGSPALTRLPLLLLGLGAIFLGWRLGRLWRNWPLAFFLALLLALWPFKAFWDVQVRYYGVELFLMLAQILAGERFLRRPASTARFALFVALTFLAALSFTMAAVLLALPWIYLAWALGARAAALAWRRVRERAPWLALGKDAALQLALLLVASLVIVQYNRGPEWLLDKLASPPPAVTLTIGGKVQPPPALKKGVAPNFPTPSGALAFLQKGVSRAFAPGAWSPAPLLGLPANSSVFSALVQGGEDSDGRRVAPWASRWLLIGLLAGAVALLFSSPPLLLSFAVIVFSTGLLIDLNAKSHFFASRYYAVPALAGLILLGAALAAAVNLARWPLCRFRPRLGAGLALGAALAAALVLGVPGLAANWRGVGRASQEWKAFVGAVKARRPGAVLYVGIGAKNLDFYHRLAAARERRHPAAGGYWSSPLRDRAHEGYDETWLVDWALFDRLGAFDAAVFFNYGYWPYSFIPFVNLRSALPPLDPIAVTGVRGSVFELGHRVYVTRGRAAGLLRPRLRDAQPAAPGSRWSMDCLFEVPGPYTLTITPPGGVSVTSMTYAGAPLAFTKEPLPQQGDKPTSGAQSAEAALAAALDPVWRASAAERPPLPRAPRARYVARLQAPLGTTQTLPLTLALDQPVTSDSTALVEWRYDESRWAAVTDAYEAGPLRAWSDGRRFYFGAPLRLTRAAGVRLLPQMHLVDVLRREKLGGGEYPIEPRREWRPGDVAWLGPYSFGLEQAARMTSRTLALAVSPFRQRLGADPGSVADPLIPSRRILRPLPLFGLSYLRFVWRDGQPALQLAPVQ